MAAEDARVRAELAATGALFDGYHPRMEAVHRANARRLAAVFDAVGWPGVARVGRDAAEAAWRVVQHAVGEPAFVRRGLALLRDAVLRGDAEPAQLAYLEDRVATLEGRPQRYGTQFDWDDAGLLSPRPLDDPDGVDARRRSLGLDSLAERTAAMRARAAAEGEVPPPDAAARRRAAAAWAVSAGWRPAAGGAGGRSPAPDGSSAP